MRKVVILTMTVLFCLPVLGNIVLSGTGGNNYGDISGWKNYCPGKIQNQYWANSTQEWKDSEPKSYQYNEQGEVVFEQGTFSAPIRYTYDEAGRMVEKVVLWPNDAGGYDNISKTVYTYDEKIPSCNTSQITYNWADNNWVQYSGWKLDIRRNDDGTVNYLGYISISESQEKLRDYYDIAYTDGKASKITHYEWKNSVLTPTDSFEQIVWKTTDGQFLNLWNEKTLYQGTNQILSASYHTMRDVPVVGTLTATYSDNANDFEYIIVARDTTLTSMKYIQLDNYGSFKEEASTRNDFFGNTFNDKEYTWTRTFRYDQFGLMLEQTFVEHCEGEITSQKYQQGIVSYDETSGFPLEYVMQEKYNFIDWQNSIRKLYSDYPKSEVGIDGISDDNTVFPIVYYTLDGLRTETPTKGLYIKKQGMKTSKVIIR